MTTDKPNPPIDLSRAKELPRSFNLDDAKAVVEANGDPKRNLDDEDDLSREKRAENLGERQTTIANIPGASVVSKEGLG